MKKLISDIGPFVVPQPSTGWRVAEESLLEAKFEPWATLWMALRHTTVYKVLERCQNDHSDWDGICLKKTPIESGSIGKTFFNNKLEEVKEESEENLGN